MKTKGLALSMPMGIGMGVGLCIMISVFGCGILAWLVTEQSLEMESVGFGIQAVLIFASIAGCGLGMKKVERRHLQVCGMIALGFFLTLLILGLILGGSAQGIPATFGCILLGGGISLVPKIFGWGSGASKYKMR